MKALVVGGAASGKSAYAEQLACALSPVRSYLATMAAVGSEAQERIAKHRAQRFGAGFETIESAASLAVGKPSDHAAAGVLLIDDVGNVVSNALFSSAGAMGNPDSVLARLENEFSDLCQEYAHVVVVGNIVGADALQYTDETNTWVRTAGALCAKFAAHCDALIEVVAGIPQVVCGVSELQALYETGQLQGKYVLRGVRP